MKMFRRVAPVVFLSASAAMAQQTGLAGRVTDASGAVVPNAVVDVKQVGAAVFHTRSNGEGTWILPALPAGDYAVTVTADGFSTMETKVSMLVGQTPTVTSVLPAAGANSSVVVTAEAMAVDTTTSSVAGNVTPSEVQGTPINGRNYMSLATLVPGVKINAVSADVPVGAASESGKFQITMDGLQVSQDTAGSSFGQPRFSQDAISQFQIITNRFDATLGRSAGVYVNAQSKSGTNGYHGGAFGFFRNSALNAPDPITKTVLPFSDQQYGGTLGGPVMKDKLWFFGSFEGERQPNTVSTTSPVNNVLYTHPQTLHVNEYLGRGDYQINSNNHILLRGDGFTYKNDYLGVTGGNTDPSRAYAATRSSYGFVADWNSAPSTHLVNDLRVGFHHFGWQNLPYTASIQITLPQVVVGGPYNYPQIFSQNTQQYRDDLFWLKGKHTLRVGGEYLYTAHGGFFQQNVRGASTCTVASGFNYATAFPNGTLDPTTWNLGYISSQCTSNTFVQGFGDFTVNVPRSILGIYAQDDWKILPRLTLNLGVRFDDDLGAFTGGPKLTNGLLTPKGNDNNNFAPRLGFAYDVMGDGKTSVRGGAGLYYADISANQIIDQQIFNGVSTIQASVSGTGGTLNLSNPFNGGNPASNPGAYLQAVQPLAQGAQVPYSVQLSLGVQRQLASHTIMTADFVHTRAYKDWVRLQGNYLVDPTNPQRNLNSASNLAASTPVTCGNGSVTVSAPATGATGKQVCNQSFTTVNQFFTPPGSGSIYDALQVGARHQQGNFNAALAYTWGRTKNSTEGPFYYPNKPFAANIKDEWANGTDDQRHSLTVNGEYKWKYGLALSSLYRFGSGPAFATATGTSGPNGYSPSFNRTLAAGLTPVAAGAGCTTNATTLCVYAPLSQFHFDAGYGYYVMNRNAIRGRAYERLDARLQETFPIHERFKATVGVEVFNMMNHFNPATYFNNANAATFGRPSSAQGSGLLEYASRQIQFLARFSF